MALLGSGDVNRKCRSSIYFRSRVGPWRQSHTRPSSNEFSFPTRAIEAKIAERRRNSKKHTKSDSRESFIDMIPDESGGKREDFRDTLAKNRINTRIINNPKDLIRRCFLPSGTKEILAIFPMKNDG